MVILYKIKKVLALAFPSLPFEAYYRAKWERKAKKQVPELLGKETDYAKMRLIIGLNRSGTTWLGTVLSKTTTPIRYLMEGLFSFQPKLNLSPIEDHTSLQYGPLGQKHRLFAAYRSFVAGDVHKYGLQPHLEREDSNWEYCLTKQVHALLATESLIQQLDIPIILMVRNPLYVADSLLHRDGERSFSLRNEWHYVQEPTFLDRFFPEKKPHVLAEINKIKGWLPDRKKVIQRVIVTTALLNQMMCILAAENKQVLLVEYEKLCLSPMETFQACAAHFGLAYRGRMKEFLEKTITNEPDSSTRLPVFRNLQEQLNKPFKFLNGEEVEEAKRVLKVLDYKL